MIKKENLIRFYVKYKDKVNHFSNTIYPFLIILAFVLTLPTLSSMQLGWIFAFIILILVCNLVFTQLEKAFKNETSIEYLLNKNKETIKDLERDIKHLEKRNLRKQELKNEYPKKKKSLFTKILIGIIILIIGCIYIYYLTKGGLK